MVDRRKTQLCRCWRDGRCVVSGAPLSAAPAAVAADRARYKGSGPHAGLSVLQEVMTGTGSHGREPTETDDEPRN